MLHLEALGERDDGEKKQSLQNDVSLRLDRAIVKVHLGKQLAFPTPRVSETEAESVRGALERLLKAHIDEFRRTKNNTDGRDSLIWWLLDFGKYLDLHLPPSKRGLYDEPLQYLAMALSDLDKGLVQPPLERAAIRPFAGFSEVKFKVQCVLAADEIHKSAQPPGKKRSGISREEADERILRRVKKAAKARGLSMSKGTIEGWRRAIREASAHEKIKTGYRVLGDVVDHHRSAHGSEFVIKWLLDRAIDSDTIV